MGLFGGPSSKEIDAFAKDLAQTIAKRYPPSLDATPEKRISANRITKVLEDALNRAAEFNRTHRLGVYKRARLGNTFRWELKELGYSEKFIEIATEGLIVYVSGAQKQTSDSPSK
ncbi:MAG TPA: hypothetical protein VNE59_11280 [Burkholderiales bacterium]|nr:hypothetical protein [Burkholderiales bacterium]